MHRFYFARLGLCKEAGEAPSTESGAGTAPPPPVVAPPVVEPPAEQAAKPTLIDRAKALLKSKPDMQAEITQLRTQLGSLNTERDQARATITALTTERDTARAQVAQIQSLLDTAEQQNRDVAGEVNHQLAAAGVPERQLPGAALPKPVGAKAKTLTTTEFMALSHEDRAEFSRNGGRCVEPGLN